MDIVYWWGVTMSLFEDDPNLIRRQERQVREQAERARAMRQRIESVQGVGVSPDSSVEIIVDSAGTLLGIGIEARPTRCARPSWPPTRPPAATLANR